MADTGKRIDQLPEAGQIGDNDLIPMEQGSTAKKLPGYRFKEYAQTAIDSLTWLGETLAAGQPITVEKRNIEGTPTIVIGIPAPRDGVDGQDGRDGRDGADSGKIQPLVVFDAETDASKKYYSAVMHIDAAGKPTMVYEQTAGDPTVWGDMRKVDYDSDGDVLTAGGIKAYIDAKLDEIDAALQAVIGGGY